MKNFQLIVAALAWGMAGWAAYTALCWSLARHWPAVPCIVLVSWVDKGDREKPYIFQVKYRYSWGARGYEGRTYQEDYRGSADIAEADRLARAFPIGSNRVCYVNPRKPSQAVLEPDNPWIATVLAVAMFLNGAFLAAVRFFPRPRSLLLGAPFLIILGLSGYVGFFGRPLWKGLSSLGWRATPCVIQSGVVRPEFHGGLISFTAHWPDLVYRYEVGGVAYRSNTYNASALGSPWYYGARGVVRRHPPGMRATCYVNPADPSEAVLDRTPSGTQWFGVWPLILAVLGGWGIVIAVTGRGDTIGTPRLWGTLALGIGTTSALTVLWITGSDLLRDFGEGVAEWPEYLAVAVAGVVSVGLTCGWIRLAVKHPGQGARHGIATTPSIVWDRELDRIPAAKTRRP
ncbi:MAG TPA: DUF3592 domain-containing protein [Isosphaeraceae bacterium]|nr:DUF3592 domain-containing protein [Isosphaeraceae bacterium]